MRFLNLHSIFTELGTLTHYTMESESDELLILLLTEGQIERVYCNACFFLCSFTSKKENKHEMLEVLKILDKAEYILVYFPGRAELFL